jgi:hypothetical protein
MGTSVGRNGRRPVTALTPTTYRLSAALAVVAIVARVATFFVPSLLRGACGHERLGSRHGTRHLRGRRSVIAIPYRGWSASALQPQQIRRSTVALVGIKAVHTLPWFSIESCMIYLSTPG